ncbi:pentapeptide repeat-containing protein [Symbioplanes lichenis]|uniref:pentapeptide repeat-containing protein n=1 Tax=Symbioplanes lichenis TaxID=1629072 RepID=UPI00273A4921|nr:pentapeptide repeat-containing protein [Actinoplanes lichenis]
MTDLSDLPYAKHLQPFAGPLGRDEDYTEVHLDGGELEDPVASGARFGESAITGTTFTGGDFGQARLSDVWISRTRWIGTSWAEAELMDVTVLDGVLAGVQAYGGSWRRVVVQGCKVDSLNLRGARLQDVVFRDCDLTEVDFGGATLVGVTFPGSALRRARFSRVVARKPIDLRGARELDVAEGWESLRGAIIDRDQLAEAAPALAQALGIVVRDR